MTPRFHPEAALLIDYASGALPLAFSVLIATHLTLCPECRAVAATMDAVGGIMLEQAEPAPVPDRCLAEIMAAVDQEPALPAIDPQPALPAIDPKPGLPAIDPERALPSGWEGLRLPAPLQRFLAHSSGGASSAWRRVMPGLSQIEVMPRRGAVRARLMRIDPGIKMPRHRHEGREMLVVLGGGYIADDVGYHYGDVALADQHIIHRPLADPAEGCVCFAVTDAPVKLAGLLGEVLNLFVRF